MEKDEEPIPELSTLKDICLEDNETTMLIDVLLQGIGHYKNSSIIALMKIESSLVNL